MLTGQCDTSAVHILRHLMKSSIPLLVTPDRESASHQSSVICDLDLIQNIRRSLPASATSSGFISCVGFIDILPLLGLFGIIKQIWHPSGGNMMKWKTRGRVVFLGPRPWENIFPRGSIPSCYPHWDVICIYCIYIGLNKVPPPVHAAVWLSYTIWVA